MNNFAFLQKFQQLQYGIMFDKIIDLPFASLVYCEKDFSEFWNQALVNTVLTGKELQTIEDTFQQLHRKSTIYFEHTPESKEIQSFLKAHNYEKQFEDSWMFYSESLPISTERFDTVKKVTNAQELDVFLETFNNSYQKDDPQNPYGELGNYLKVAEYGWYKHTKTNRMQYFIVFEGIKPVAVSTLTNYQNIGYISNVGSLREVRGKGFGKLATLYCVAESQKLGNTIHCLATEEKTYPNEFYSNIGFKTKFTAVGYSKIEE